MLQTTFRTQFVADEVLVPRVQRWSPGLRDFGHPLRVAEM